MLRTTLIIGGSGQLGAALRIIFPKAVFTYNSKAIEGGVKLDLVNGDLIEKLIRELKPDLVINAAALTDVDGCETSKDIAYMVNAKAMMHITRASLALGSYLIHISTDYVFDGEKGTYREDDVPNPINYYGLSKLIGEAYTLTYDKSLIIRTSGVFGYKDNFPLFALKKLHEGQPVNAVEMWYSPIHADLLAKSIAYLQDQEAYGIINVAGERVSRYELAVSIADIIGADSSNIKKVEFGKASFLKARRPRDSSLNITKAKSILNFDFYTTKANLNLMIQKWRESKSS